jgi:hypothetical protein
MKIARLTVADSIVDTACGLLYTAKYHMVLDRTENDKLMPADQKVRAEQTLQTQIATLTSPTHSKISTHIEGTVALLGPSHKL